MNRIQSRLALLVSAGLSVCSAVATAQTAPLPAAEAPAASPIVANVSVVSDYRFRGISQTYKQPALQGGFDYAHISGAYVGTWLSSVSGNSYYGGAGLEADIYAGYKFEPVKDVGVDVGVLQYIYPGANYKNAPNNGVDKKQDNTELYVAASYQFATFKVNYAVSDFFGLNSDTAATAANPSGAKGKGSKGSYYLDLTLNPEIADKTNLILHVGRQEVKNFDAASYTDYKVGVTKDVNGVVFGLAAITTNANKVIYSTGNGAGNKKLGESTVVLSVAKTF
jgi:uncharacterized protein (TIGR02001 family)